MKCRRRQAIVCFEQRRGAATPEKILKPYSSLVFGILIGLWDTVEQINSAPLPLLVK
jgi:hypothetical protein